MQSVHGLAATAAVVLASFSPSLRAQDARDAKQPSASLERWIVRLHERAFDLEPYRAALLADADAARMDAVVSGLEAAVTADQAPIAASVERLGGRVRAQWWIVNGLAIELAADQVEALRALPRVAAVSRDTTRRPGIKTTTNAANHASDLVQAMGIRGAGVTVAIVDSGVDDSMGTSGRPHATFYIGGDPTNRTGPGIGGSRLLANIQVGAMPPDDLINHGTPVAGVAAGARWNMSNVADDGHAPAANIVSYSVANDAQGGTLASTLIAAWQRVAADKVRYGIQVANCSYEGIFYLNSPGLGDQEALDTTALLADILITGMGGNGGSQQSFYGYGATNMLAVGACENDNRRVAAFSLRGPAQPVGVRTLYPDLIANGVGIYMPFADNEAISRWSQGTSYAAPQVAGAAALYRSARPAASAMETRAAILASTEDVLALQAPSDRSRNAVGHGYLRTDYLIHAAQHAAITTLATLTRSQPNATFPLDVRAGRSYGVAIVWFRNPRFGAVNELDLELLSGQTVIARAATDGNHDELIRHVATTTARLTIRVLGRELPTGTESFALVATDLPTQVIGGTLRTFGSACTLANSVLLVDPQATPRTGTTYSIEYRSGLFNTAARLLLGTNNTSHLGQPLPWDLTGAGAPGCSLLVSPALVLDIPFHGTGQSTIVLPVPGDRWFVGARLFHQALALHQPSNPLGIVLSNGVEAVIGGTR